MNMAPTLSHSLPLAPSPRPRVPVSPRRAFTLIELLVVVAIVAILTAIAIPNLSLATRRADQARCASNLKALAYALFAYKIDNNVFPPADGTAGPNPSPNHTLAGQGPAANGSWDGVSWLLLQGHYITNTDAFYCSTLKKRFPARAKYFRYAYNNSATDTGMTSGGASNIEQDAHDLWFLRCLWIPSEASFHPETPIPYPHGDDEEMENVLLSNGRVELRNGREDYNRR